MIEHIDGIAPLYSLGILEDAERAHVEEHARTCDACARAIAQASDDVAAMEAAQPIIEPPRQLQARMQTALLRGGVAPIASARSKRWYAGLAASAAIVILALSPSMYLWQQNQTMRQAMIADADAMARVASSPHRTVAFSTATRSRVMYATDGSWYFVVVRGADAPVDVVWKHDGHMTKLGTAVPHGDIAMLYLPQSHRMDQLALMQQGTVMGQARLVF